MLSTIVRDVVNDLVSLAFVIVAHSGIYRYPSNPWLEMFRIMNLVNAFENAYECFLENILCLFSAPRIPPAQAEHLWPEHFVQCSLRP